MIESRAATQALPARSRSPAAGAGLAAAGIVVAADVALLSPFPRGGNLPAAWLIWALVVTVTVGLQMALGPTRQRAQTAPLARGLIALAALFAAYGATQAAVGAAFLFARGAFASDGANLPPFASLAPAASLLAAARIASSVLFFWLVGRAVRAPGAARTLGHVLTVGVAFHGALALAAALGDGADLTAGGLSGPFANPNGFATYLAMGAAFGLAQATSPATGARRGLLLISVGMTVIALLATGSRAGIASGAAGAGLVLLARLPRPQRWLAAVTAGLAIWFLATRLPALGPHLSEGLALRTDLYGNVLEAIAARPMTGFGLDTFPLLFELIHRPPVLSDVVWTHAHSSYLTLWAEAGVLFGSLPMLAGLVAAMHLARRAMRPAPGQSLALGALAALVAAALHATVDFSLELQANLFLLLAIVAAGLSDRAGKGTQP